MLEQITIYVIFWSIYQMRSRLVSTTFSAGADDKIATVDAFSLENASVTNIIPDVTDLGELKSLDVLKGGNLLPQKSVDDMTTIKHVKNYGLQVTPDSIEDTLTNTNTDVTSSFRNLTLDVQANLKRVNTGLNPAKKAIDDLNKTTKGIADKINTPMMALKNSVNGISKVTASGVGGVFAIKNAIVGNLKGIEGMIHGLIDCVQIPTIFKDITGMINAATNLIREATKMGYPNPYKKFSDCAVEKPENQPMLASVTRNLAPDIVNTSSTTLLKQVADGPVANELMIAIPGFERGYTDNYTKPMFATTDDILAEFGAVDTSLDKIDPGRKTYGYGDDVSINAASAISASDDYKYIANVAAANDAVPIDTSSPDTINTALNTTDNQFIAATVAAVSPATDNDAPIAEDMGPPEETIEQAFARKHEENKRYWEEQDAAKKAAKASGSNANTSKPPPIDLSTIDWAKPQTTSTVPKTDVKAEIKDNFPNVVEPSQGETKSEYSGGGFFDIVETTTTPLYNQPDGAVKRVTITKTDSSGKSTRYINDRYDKNGFVISNN